jgi:hypothetical protein
MAKKKKETLEKEWAKSGQKFLRRIEDCCGGAFTDTSKQEESLLYSIKRRIPRQAEA